MNTGVGSVSGRKPDEAETVVTWSHFTRPSLSLLVKPFLFSVTLIDIVFASVTSWGISVLTLRRTSTSFRLVANKEVVEV